MVETCCHFFSLSTGTLLAGLIVSISSLAALAHLIDVSDDSTLEERGLVLTTAIFGNLAMSALLLVIGVIIITAYLFDAYRVLKVVALMLLTFTVIRLGLMIWRFAVEGEISTFIVIFSFTLFFFYACLVVWSYSQELEFLKRMENLPLEADLLRGLSRPSREGDLSTTSMATTFKIFKK